MMPINSLIKVLVKICEWGVYRMRLENDKEFIEISFDDEYVFKNYIEICLNFTIEGSGWGVVSDHYFTLEAVKTFSENLSLLINNKIDEFHYSDNEPKLIPKPFYWFDIKRVEDGYDTHIKIHDCLMEYIEISEIINLNKLSVIQKEFSEAIESMNNSDVMMRF